MFNDKTQTRLKALETVVAKEQDRLFRAAYLRVGSRADAEDIVQDVFLKLFRSDENLRHVRNLEHYLFRSVTNSCRDFLRRRQFNLVGIETVESASVDESESLIYEEYLRISKLLETLPEEQAEVVRLKCTDGLKFREIAMILEIPEATAKSRYRYGISHIQKSLKD